MDQQPAILPTSVLIALALAIWLCASVWVFVGVRLWNKQPVLPLVRRRQVPWGGLDILIVFAFYILTLGLMVGAVEFILGPGAKEPAAGAAIGGKDVETSHEIVQLFRGGNPLMVIFCVFSAVIVAPVVEEFLFRVLLQGWFESLDRRIRPMLPSLRRMVPWGAIPIALCSLAFAMVHFRTASPPRNTEYLLYLMVGHSLVSIATLVFSVSLLRLKNGATAADMGFVTEKILPDAGLGIASAAGLVFPMLMLQVILTNILPDWVAADPIPLFFFAVAMGFLYFRTHRIVASIVLHAALNASSLLLLLLYLLEGGGV